MAERDLDDIFYNDYGLTDHKHNVKYPGPRKYDCDWVFGGKYWVEYAGLTGKPWYDENIEEKKQIAQENNLDLTIITQDDFVKGMHLKKVNHIINELGSINQSLDGFG
jgi:hypothetical protein